MVEFEADAWPGEDRTYVVDDPEEALALTLRFAVEHGAEGSVVLVVGDQEFVAAVAALVS